MNSPRAERERERGEVQHLQSSQQSVLGRHVSYAGSDIRGPGSLLENRGTCVLFPTVRSCLVLMGCACGFLVVGLDCEPLALWL